MLVGVRVGVGAKGFDRAPQYVEVLGHRVNIIRESFKNGEFRFFDFSFTEKEIRSLASATEKGFSILCNYLYL